MATLKLLLLKTAILRSISYFDIFNHPLRKGEIMNLCNVKERHDVFEDALGHLIKEEKCFEENGYYSLQKDFIQSIELRKEKEKRAQGYFAKLPFYANIIKSFPFVKALAISGSLSKNVMHEDGDIDYFVITSAGRLWICRTLLILFKKIFLLNSRKYFCVNYFIDENNLEITDENIFTAIELAYLIPVYNPGLIQKMKDKNKWTGTYFPSFEHFITVDAVENKTSVKKWVEKLFQNSLADRIDLFFMKLTYKRWKRKFPHFSNSKFELTMRTNRGVSKHHPQDFQNKVLKEFQSRMKDLNIVEETKKIIA